MTASDFFSGLALLVSSGALFLEVRRWFESGPRIHLTLMADAEMIPLDDGKDKFASNITNRGELPTLITHVVTYGFENRWERFRRKNIFAGVLVQPALPKALGPNAMWTAVGNYSEKMKKLRDAEQLYVGVLCSNSDKEYLIKVPPAKTEGWPTKQPS